MGSAPPPPRAFCPTVKGVSLPFLLMQRLVYGRLSSHLHVDCVTVTAERNLNPKAACLKRREEEKGTEFLTTQSASLYPDLAAQPLVVRIC